MAHCPTCNSELADNHPALMLKSLLEYVEDSGGWTLFDGFDVGDRIPGFPEVEIVGLKTTYDSGDINTDDYYGESPLPQGAEFQTYVVFKIGELFYKKTGTGDSYGDVDWNGDIRQVEAKPKTVWEFK